MKPDRITLAHGSGCRATRELIENLILKHLGNPELAKLSDSALINIEGKELAFTTDSYTVNPIFLPGSDIGKLSIYGTVNDLAVMGAKPLYVSLSMIIEEGLLIEELEKVVLSIKEAKEVSEVEILCGDIKVVEKGKCDKLFITTSGIGLRLYEGLGIDKIRISDRLIVNGPIGEHEIAVLIARGDFKFKAEVKSDCQPLWGVIKELISKCREIRFMRDITRGGLGTVLNEILRGDFGIQIYEDKIPITKQVRAISEILGYDPLYLANEGKFLLVIGKEEEELALRILGEYGYGYANCIGEITDRDKGKVVLHTTTGGMRLIDYPYGTQLPRIC